jgi:hypothetical protein
VPGIIISIVPYQRVKGPETWSVDDGSNAIYAWGKLRLPISLGTFQGLIDNPKLVETGLWPLGKRAHNDRSNYGIKEVDERSATL